MIARSIESGSTVMKRNAFISRAVNKTKKDAEAAMQKVFEEGIEKFVKRAAAGRLLHLRRSF